MSDANNHGGPAFPCDGDTAWDGMTLRQFYAGVALAGLAGTSSSDPEVTARRCVALADTLIAVLDATESIE